MTEPDIPAELLKLRTATGLSQENFAKEINVKYSNYRRYESGETAKVPAEVLVKAQRESPRLVADFAKRKRGDKNKG